MAKHKNLTKENLKDVSIYEEITLKKSDTNNKICLLDVPIRIKCFNENQKELKKAIEENDIVISTGIAGTGKTYLSLLTALHILKTEPKYSKLVLIKSLQVIKGEELGYLKGELESKIYPYMYSFISNLDKIFGDKNITQSLINQRVIELFPIAYTRGVGWDNSIIIVDETQNINLHIFKTLITRLGKNSKIIFLGDTDQIDLKNKYESCLLSVFNLFSNDENVKTIKLDDSSCVRNPIIPKILNKLKTLEN